MRIWLQTGSLFFLISLIVFFRALEENIVPMVRSHLFIYLFISLFIHGKSSVRNMLKNYYKYMLIAGEGSGYPVSLQTFLEISHISLIVQSRIPKLRVEYPHISNSNIPYPYNFFLKYPVSP